MFLAGQNLPKGKTIMPGFFKDQGVYTPEMIVNGSDAFVGSDQAQLQKDLDQ